MTQPIAHGYPDYGRQISESDINILEYEDAAFTGDLLFDPLFVGNAPYLFVSITSVANVRVTVTFYTDPGANFNLGFEHVSTGGTGEAAVCIPVRGTYVEVYMQIDPGDEPEFVTLQVYAVRHPYNRLSNVDSPTTLIAVQNVTVPAAGNTIFPASAVRSGRARWTAEFVGATTFTIYLHSVDFDGTETILDFVRANNRATDRQVFLPPIPVQIRGFNQDGVGRDLLAMLTVNPFT